MTEEEFRQNDGLRAELREALNNPAFREARQIILGRMFGVDARPDAPEIASVRLLGQRTGYELAFRDLEMLTAPITPPETEPEHDYSDSDQK